MAESKHRRKGKTRLPGLIRGGSAELTLGRGFREQEVLDGLERPAEEEFIAALESLPKDLTWDWTRPRIVPLFERGYDEGTTGDPLINARSGLGVGIGFGIDLGPMLARISRSMAQRWEASVEQIEAAAFTHLAEVAATVTPRDLQSVVHHGHLFRALGVPGGWASSMILTGEAEITRIFGLQDQIFTIPARNQLLAFDASTPARAVAEVTLTLESLDQHPLEIDPFVLTAGTLRWEGLSAELDDVI
jgi:hypothetical protein